MAHCSYQGRVGVERGIIVRECLRVRADVRDDVVRGRRVDGLASAERVVDAAGGEIVDDAQLSPLADTEAPRGHPGADAAKLLLRERALEPSSLLLGERGLEEFAVRCLIS